MPAQTPARRVADQLADELGQQAAMASPGPRLHNRVNRGSDLEDSSDSDFPIGPRRRGTARPPVRAPAEGEDSQPQGPPTNLGSDPTVPAGRRRRPAAKQTGTPDADGYIWAEAEDLVPEDKSADAKYFFGCRSMMDGSFKCRLCP